MTTGNVYFIGCGSTVKIGFAENVEARLAQLQTGNPLELHVLATLGEVQPQIERLYHRVLRGKRQAGEWFTYDQELRNLVANVSAGARPLTAKAVLHYTTFGATALNPFAEVRIAMKEAATWPLARRRFLSRGGIYVQAVESAEKRYLTKR